MRWVLLHSPAFARDLRAWLKLHPRTMTTVEATLEQLSADPSHPSLRTHKENSERLVISGTGVETVSRGEFRYVEECP